jgi:hypothetical protein
MDRALPFDARLDAERAASPMARGAQMSDQDTPPVGEELHLPGPTIIPLMCAVGITLAIVGTTVSLVISAIGLIIFVVTTVIWIRDTRRDIDELPEDHH